MKPQPVIQGQRAILNQTSTDLRPSLVRRLGTVDAMAYLSLSLQHDKNLLPCLHCN